MSAVEAETHLHTLPTLCARLALPLPYIRTLLLGASLYEWTSNSRQAKCVPTRYAIDNGLAVQVGRRLVKQGPRIQHSGLTDAGLKMLTHHAETCGAVPPSFSEAYTARRTAKREAHAALQQRLTIALTTIPEAASTVSAKALYKIAGLSTIDAKIAREQVDFAALGWRCARRGYERVGAGGGHRLRLVVSNSAGASGR